MTKMCWSHAVSGMHVLPTGLLQPIKHCLQRNTQHEELCGSKTSVITRPSTSSTTQLHMHKQMHIRRKACVHTPNPVPSSRWLQPHKPGAVHSAPWPVHKAKENARPRGGGENCWGFSFKEATIRLFDFKYTIAQVIISLYKRKYSKYLYKSWQNLKRKPKAYKASLPNWLQETSNSLACTIMNCFYNTHHIPVKDITSTHIRCSENTEHACSPLQRASISRTDRMLTEHQTVATPTHSNQILSRGELKAYGSWVPKENAAVFPELGYWQYAKKLSAFKVWIPSPAVLVLGR